MKYRCIKSNGNWFKKFNELLKTDSNITDKNINSYKEIFSHLIDGITFDQFIEEIFEQTPCLFKRKDTNNDTNVEILSRDSFLKIIKQDFNNEIIPDNNISAVRYINDERDDLDWYEYKVSAKKRKQNEDDDNHITSKDIEKAFSQLYTLQFYQPQRFLDNLHKISASLEYNFGTLAGSSAYLTPSPSQGLPPHHDDVDVFVLQTEGEKEWCIWNGEKELPDNYSRIAREDLPTECQKIVLRKGDMLYLPRGTIHEAIARESFSTHVTISIYQHYNMKSLLLRALPIALSKAFEKNINIRKGLPVRLSDSYGSFAAKQLEETQHTQTILSRQNMLRQCIDIVNDIPDLLDIATIDEAVDQINMDFIENRLPPPLCKYDNIISKKGKSKPISNQSTIRLVDPNIVQCAIQEVEGDSVLCVFNATYNNRLQHMGHPIDDDNDDDDEEEEESEPTGPCVVSFPSRLSPIICNLLQSYPNFTKVSELSKLMKLCFIHGDEVVECIKMLNEYNFIESS